MAVGIIPCVAVALKNLREWSAVGGEKDFAVFWIFYGLMVGKYASICALEVQKIQMVDLILLRICLIYGANASVSRGRIPLQVDLEQGAFWFTNKRVHVEILFLLKLVLFESLAWNDFSCNFARAAHFFVHFFALVLHNNNVKLPETS